MISQICVGCELDLPRQNFRGARYKARACIDCEDRHLGERWCVDCEAWLPAGDFYRVGRDQKFQTIRCKPCRVLFSHGVDRRFMAELTGSAVAACGACGSTSRLSVDHDHAHCAGERGCRGCVRGYLCRACNTAEGLLGTPDRARRLAAYMEASKLTPEQLAALPISTRPGPRTRTYRGDKRKFYEDPVLLG